MNYTFEQNQLNKFPLLYINYKELMKLTPNQRKNTFIKEMIYLFLMKTL